MRKDGKMITIENLNKVYHGAKGSSVEALKNVNLTLPDTGFVSVVGKSGCGKTTLLNAIGALDAMDSGTIRVSFKDNGYEKDIVSCSEKELNEYRNLILGCVFQDYFLVEEWTVRQNLVLALEQQGTDGTKETIASRIQEALAFVDLADCENRYIKELSGGQQQRVAIARALIKKPRIIIADEPTGNLDYENSEMILELLKKASEHCLVVMVTHDLEAAENYSDRLLKIRDGSIVFDELRTEELPQQTVFEPVGNAKRLPAKTVVSLAFESLRIRKIRLILSAVCLILLFSVFLIFLRYMYTPVGKAVSKQLKESGESFLYCKETVDDAQIIGDELYASGNTETIAKELPALFGTESCYPVQENLELTTEAGGESLGFLVIGGVPDPNYEFKGNLPKEADEIALTDKQCSELGLGGDGIGETVLINGMTFTVCGVTVTGFTGEIVSGTSFSESLWRDYMTTCITRRMIVSESYRERLGQADYLVFKGMNPISEFSETALDEKNSVTAVSTAKSKITETVYGKLPEQSYEIAVSLEYALENNMIDSDGELIEYTYRFTDLHNDVFNGAYDGTVSMYDYLPYIEIVGILDMGDEEEDFIVTDEVYEELWKDYMENRYYDSLEVKLTDATRGKSSLYQHLYEEKIFSVNFMETGLYTQFENNALYRNLYGLGCLMIAVLLVLLSILFFYFNVRDNHKKIGILRAVGVTKADIMKMLLSEAGLVAAVVIVISVVAENLFFYRKYGTSRLFSFVFFPNNIPVLLAACGCFAAVVLLSILVPMWIMAESRPMELIKQD